MRKRTRSGVLALVLAALTGCLGEERAADVDPTGAAATTLASSTSTDAQLAALRARFREAGTPADPSETVPLIRAGVATTFSRDGARARVILPGWVKAGVARSATVTLPMTASGPVLLDDDRSHVAVRFSLRGTSDASLTVADSIALYSKAYQGHDIVHRVDAEGTEDYVVFEEAPPREELIYDIDVSRVAGLRLVSNTLELLDDSGSPRLRIAPPFVVEASGIRREASLTVAGCAFDTSPAAPWGRAVIEPGAARCSVHIAWRGVRYPAIVDPSWKATGSMAEARSQHTATLLASGRVLVAGGQSGVTLRSSAELFDPTGTGSFAATGSMLYARRSHTATPVLDNVLVAGGSSDAGIGVLNTGELYDPATGTFGTTGSMAEGRAKHTATQLADGRVLMAGGNDGALAGLSSVETYDPVAKTFSTSPPMSSARTSHTATLLPSGVLMVGGATSGFASTSLSSAEIYGGVGATGSMATQRDGHTATLLASGKVLVAGGKSDGQTYRSSAEIYEPATGTFSATGSMFVPRGNFAAILLPSANVVVMGGSQFSDAGPLSATEVYNPTTGVFSATVAMAQARGDFTATLLASGIVLAAGGNDFATTFANAEVLTISATGRVCSANEDCEAGLSCTDGVCCNSACEGQCEACDVAGAAGTCTQVSGAPHGTRTTCGGDNACDATCTTDRVRCSFPTAAKSCGSACLEDQQAESACDGTGQCVVAAPTQCPGALKCGDALQCKARCAADADCRSGFACGAGGECTPRSGGTCADTHTSRPAGDADGGVAERECAPYDCDQATGECRTRCTSIDDCVSPNSCDTNGQCLSPTAPEADSGCATAPGESPAPRTWMVLGIALAVAVGAKRLRRGHASRRP